MVGPFYNGECKQEIMGGVEIDCFPMHLKQLICFDKGKFMNSTAASSGEESPAGIYISAALGAFFLGIGDLLNNNNAATVIKLSETIRQNLYPQLESGGLVALVLLVIFGAAVCWIQQPKTRVDAFARGFSVFALMAVTAPYNPVTTGLNHSADRPASAGGISSLFGISTAYAQTNTPSVPVEITLVPSSGSALPRDTRVVLRELNTGRIVGTSHISSGKFAISQPKGFISLKWKRAA
jgi:hypothetical protein